METTSSRFALLKKKKTWVVLILTAAIIYLILRFSGALETESGETEYLTSEVTSGSISVTVSGNGQVISSEDIEIKAKASGEIAALNMVKGATVERNALLASIDDVTARRSVRDAEVELENAQLTLDKLYESATELELKRAESNIVQAENDLAQLEFNYQRDKQDMERQIEKLEIDLPRAYEDAFNTVADIFVDLPFVMGDMEDLIDGHDYSSTQSNLAYYTNQMGNTDEAKEQKERVRDFYQIARASYEETLDLYQATSRSDTEALETLTQTTYDTVYDCSQVLKELNIFMTMAYDEMTEGEKNADISQLLEHLDDVSQDIGSINPHLTTIFDDLEAARDVAVDLADGQVDLENLDTEFEINKKTSELAVEEKKQDLEELKADPEELDVKEAKIKLVQKQNALEDAQADLADYSVYLPFDAIISEVDVKKGDLVSSSSTLGSAISLNKLAEITLNEIDIVNVSVGQKAILTFDALDDFSLTGEVAEVDAAGTVEQGVVSYGVTVGFDLDDDRIRPGMSVEVTLIADSKQNVLLVPNTAVKTQNEMSYVEVLEDGVPVRKMVTTGLVSDTMTEILSGLEEGETVVTSTISSGSASSSSNGNSSRGGFGGAGMMMGPPG